MSVIQSIQFFVAINLFVIGLSHFVQPKIWIDFFKFLSSKGNVGNIFNAMLSLGLGAFILSFHFLWSWPEAIITIYGLMQLLKGILYLTIPSIGLKSIRRVNEKSSKFRWAGLIMCMLAILIVCYVFK